MNESEIKTLCLGCVFATGPHTDDKFIQRGCYMDVINLFQEHGIVPQEVYDEDGNEFYVINDKICQYFRNKTWQNEDDLSECFERAREEVKLRANLVIYFDDEKDIEDLLRTVNSACNSTIKPTRIFIANNNKKIPKSNIIQRLNAECTLPWRIESIVEEYADRARSLYITINKCYSMFIYICDAGHQVNIRTLREIDILLNDEMKRILVLYDEEYLFMMRFLWKNMSMAERLELLNNIEELECQTKLIMRAKNVLPM